MQVDREGESERVEGEEDMALLLKAEVVAAKAPSEVEKASDVSSQPNGENPRLRRWKSDWELGLRPLRPCPPG